MRSSCALAGGVDGGDEPLVVDGDFEGVPFFAFGKADEEDGFACAVEGDVLQPGVVTEGGVADGGEGGLELLGSGGEDGRPLAIELGARWSMIVVQAEGAEFFPGSKRKRCWFWLVGR